MSNEISGFAVFTNQIGAGVTVAGMAADTSDLSGSVIGIGQGAQSIVSIATMGMESAVKPVAGAGGILSVTAAFKAATSIYNSYKDEKPIAQSDVAALFGNATGTLASALIIVGVGETLIIPLTVVSIGAGAYQLVAIAEGWKVDASGNVSQSALTAAQQSQAASMIGTLQNNASMFESALQSAGLGITESAAPSFLVPRVDSAGNLTTSITERAASSTVLANGDTQYRFADGTILTVAAVGGDPNDIRVDAFDRIWSIPTSDGGTATLYVNCGNGSFEYKVKDANGNTLPGSVSITNADSDGDGQVDSITTETRLADGSSVITQDTNGDGTVDRNVIVNNGQSYDLSNVNDAIFADSLLSRYYATGLLSGTGYQDLSQIICTNAMQAPIGAYD